ncbi:MAG: hypothetical protein J1F10_00380 [Muribaculaceae bacterium]|nr:hypothetical protein [Muribaculaceae bacterium]
MLKINFKKFADLCLALAVPAAVALSSCSDNDITSVDGNTNSDVEKSNLTTVKLATFNGDASRITYGNGTRAEGDVLSLVATIANPSKAEGFNFSKETDGRYMSATSVYYNDADGKYYVTYHMQGNNYNTELTTETAGAIQEFSFNEEGELVLGKGFRAADPRAEDFDFNHIYFDQTSNRIIAAGHNVLKGNQKDTHAIVGVFNPTDSEFKYALVKTNEKVYADFANPDNKDGHKTNQLVDYADAGDVNCIVRTNDNPNPWGWPLYLVATRKGMAVLSADEETLFDPVLIPETSGSDKYIRYFVNTPGSAKYIAPTGVSSYYGLLYLTYDHKAETGKDIEATTSSPAKIAHISINTHTGLYNGDLKDWGHIQTWNSPFAQLDPQKLDEFPEQEELPEDIQPVDGKNTLVLLGSVSETYAALGKNGVYYKNGETPADVMKFGDRPVNCVAVDNKVTESGHSQKGYLYVANGAKLTILKRDTMEEVVSYNMPYKGENDEINESSANFIHVKKADNGERIVTVAYGQAGVKIFKFVPPTKL